MTTFLEDEASNEASQPREAIEIRIGMQMHRIATGTRDVVINGQRYIASPSAREEIKLANSQNEADLVIRLPMKHAVPQRWLALGSPPKTVEVNVYRLQTRSGEYERIWNGYVTSLSTADNNATATLRVPSRATALLDRRLPPAAVGRSCSHLLYDANCRVDRAGFVIDTTVTGVNGRTVTVDPVGVLLTESNWATGGEMLVTASGERMSVFTQDAGGEIVLQMAIGGLQIGDAVQVFAGCAHDIEACHNKFDNRANYGGYPQLITVLPNGANGTGVFAAES